MMTTQIVRNEPRAAQHLLGGTVIERLSPPSENAYCVMMGAIPSGACVPLHSHEDPESFYVMSGTADVLAETANGLQWLTLSSGEFVHIPGGAKHAWRNPSSETALMLCTCTAKLGRALEEMGEVRSKNDTESLSPEVIQQLLEIAERFGYWMGSPEENAAVGIRLS